MLKEIFIGRQPSHFQVNNIVKSFIFGETLLWTSWNFVMPIFALFTITVPGGNVEIAASSYSVYLVVRVFGELISGRMLTHSGELRKFLITILGMLIMSLGYLGFSITKNVASIYLYYAIIGIGLGIASPAKNSLFSTHLDKNAETLEWGMLDASVFLCMALSAVTGGFIATKYGFSILFIVSAIVNLAGIIPYLLYIRHEETWREKIRSCLNKTL